MYVCAVAESSFLSVYFDDGFYLGIRILSIYLFCFKLTFIKNAAMAPMARPVQIAV